MRAWDGGKGVMAGVDPGEEGGESGAFVFASSLVGEDVVAQTWISVLILFFSGVLKGDLKGCERV